jgi:hypothetical protein
VVCGGRIKHVVNMSDWSDLDGSDIVYVTIDDAVGDLLILVPGLLWRESEAKHGEIVIASGLLFALNKECKFVSKAGGDIIVNRGNEPFRVLVKTIHKLQEEDAE